MKKAKRIWISLVACLLALALFAVNIPVVGRMEVHAEKSSKEIQEEIDELEKEQKEIEKQIKELENLVTENMSEVEIAVSKKSAVDQQVALLYQQKETINKQIVAYGKLIAEKQKELDDAEAALAKMKEDNKARIRAMEKNSMTSSYWAVVFQAENFLDLLDQLKMVARIQESDEKMIRELTQAAEDVEVAKLALEDQKAELEAKQEELDATEEQLIEKKTEAEALLEELMEKNKEYLALVEEAEILHAANAEELEGLEEDYDEAKHREYLEYLASLPPPKPKPPVQTGGTTGGGTTGGGGNVTTNGETWGYPTSYIGVSSVYGYRIHPVYGDQRFHHGIDLAAYQGTPIYAARSGTVTIASYDWSSGYWVNINHGDGFTSRYLHMTHYVVSAGQYVTKGQVIGYVGSTGTSTGPHLHFGIYYNGSSVNPSNYIRF